MTIRTFVLVLGCALLLAMVALAQNGQPINSPQIPDLVIANHILANEGVLDAYGHVSVRDERNPAHFFLARGLPPSVVTAADIAEYDQDSKPVPDSQNAGYTERFIHGEIYRARPD